MVAVLGGGLTQIGVALAALMNAFLTTQQPETDPSSWQDGGRVRIGGVVQAAGERLKTPFTGQDAVCMEFAVRVADHAKGEVDSGLSKRRHIPPGMCGYDQVPFGIVTTRGLIAVAGTPPLIYRESPPRIEISNWIRDSRAMEAIRPGLADVTAKAQLRFEFISLLLGVTVTGWLHYAVYANGGALYRSLIEKFAAP